MVDNFCKYCLTYGAKLVPLEIERDKLIFDGGNVCNPSIFDDNGVMRLALRNVNYFFNYSETKRFETSKGCLCYYTPDDDNSLRTENYISVINDDLTLSDIKHIDTSDNDKEPNWVFVGEEDVRLVRWNGKLYATGCRRDVESDGKSRMELSEIDPETGKELSRVRLSTPNNEDTYAEKNWMPIIDMPYHYVKWCFPTEIVKVDPNNGDCEIVNVIHQNSSLLNGRDYRGSSQVIPYKNGWHIALVHEVEGWLNEKSEKYGEYYMRWVVWDDEWNIIKVSDTFHFMNCKIEFTNGLSYRDGKFYIPFAIYDNVSFLMVVDDDIVDKFIGFESCAMPKFNSENNIFTKFVNNSRGFNECVSLAEYYYQKRLYSPAKVMYLRAAEYSMNKDDAYNALFMCGMSVAKVGYRDSIEKDLWVSLLMLDSFRSEGYVALSRYYHWRGEYFLAHLYAKQGYENNNYKNISNYSETRFIDGYYSYIETLYNTSNYQLCEEYLYNFYNYVVTHNLSSYYIDKFNGLMGRIKRDKSNIKKIV